MEYIPNFLPKPSYSATSASQSPFNSNQHGLPKCHGSQQLPGTRRLTRLQRALLQQAFKENPYPSARTQQKLAYCIHMSFDRVNNWFANTRAKLHRDQKDAKVYWNRKLAGVEALLQLASLSSQRQPGGERSISTSGNIDSPRSPDVMTLSFLISETQ
ncbi:hypothetical protein BCR33DRAFT_732535 [Rhizoclosmatium globosum]|uniref:Homeobox domain-containing protein n=1 Tax=Rhizoclosmatium globosum TaxID=329046 RepID=A0A1Y2D370_9FUNG|nr:hypothetical protein BCR33DRAFT_732535 [Rhizoclosmatium globosum]|eukprot:ORY53731.1 hypothetical protein BCR33DRAFT_732535 [Rhizoclosmatium globosum]